jgi:hypothetical protein
VSFLTDTQLVVSDCLISVESLLILSCINIKQEQTLLFQNTVIQNCRIPLSHLYREDFYLVEEFTAPQFPAAGVPLTMRAHTNFAVLINCYN